MNAIIGGPPSTGSSLLIRILNRHSQIFASHEESHLFSKSELYNDWENYKRKILKKGAFGLRSPGWHLYNGVRLHNNVWTHDALSNLISECPTFESFVNEYYSRLLSIGKKLFWIEKTPANVLCFRDFLSAFDDALVIGTIRSPFEIIASLISRGLTIYNAVGVTLINFAHIPKPSDRVEIIRYENLVTETQKVIQELCLKLKVDFEGEMLVHEENEYKMDGWQYSETGPIINPSESRFLKLSPLFQAQIRFACEHIMVNPKWSLYRDDHPQTIKELCQQWNYNYLTGDIKSFPIHAQLRADKWNRTRRGYPTHFLNYPIVVT